MDCNQANWSNWKTREKTNMEKSLIKIKKMVLVKSMMERN